MPRGVERFLALGDQWRIELGAMEFSPVSISHSTFYTCWEMHRLTNDHRQMRNSTQFVPKSSPPESCQRVHCI
jgi:hypothetical protein